MNCALPRASYLLIFGCCCLGFIFVLKFIGRNINDTRVNCFWGKGTKLANSETIVFESLPSPSGAQLYKYRPTINGQKCNNGSVFGVSSKYLRTLDFPTTIDPVQLTAGNVDQFVFVTGADDTHFYECMDAIGTVQKFFPNYTIYYYDMNYRESYYDIAEKVPRLKNVIYRRFNFSRYPPHVKNLKLYAFKAAVVHEVLQNHSGVFWIDASIRFYSSNLTLLYNKVMSNGGILLLVKSATSNFQTTHPGMYRYLPIEEKRASETWQRGSGEILLYRTKEIYENIVGWWLLCSLEPQCIAPTHLLWPCNIKSRATYAGCHRFDQSAINILITNYYQYKEDMYYLKVEYILNPRRDTQNLEILTVMKYEKNLAYNIFSNRSSERTIAWD